MGFRKLCIILGSGLGIGLASVSVYLLYRKVAEEDWFGLGVRGEVIKIPSKMPSQYIRVPTYLVSRLIGQNGQNIREMEAQTQTQIHFENDILGVNEERQSPDLKDSEDSDNNDWIDVLDNVRPSVAKKKFAVKGYRLMSIRGKAQNVKRVEEMVNAIISEHNMESMPIPDGCNIVGHDGQIINEIRDQTGARLELEGGRHSTNRSVLIIGNDGQRGCAKRMINKIIDEFFDQNNETND